MLMLIMLIWVQQILIIALVLTVGKDTKLVFKLRISLVMCKQL